MQQVILILSRLIATCRKQWLSNNSARFILEEINVAFVKTKKTQYHWDLYREIIKYSTKYNQQQSQFWTIISDEQTFIVMANLRRLLSAFNNSQQSFILGRISSKRNLRSYLFPWNIYTTILPQAGIVFSHTALDLMTNDACFGWLSPRATERALIRCSNLMNVQLVDPIDKDGKHLFIPNGFNELIAGSELDSSKKMQNPVYCCSDQGISFGSLNYRDHRILDYATARIKVFGY
ncbi:unnamed protein product [Wuchereria bancrofti]|uniref:N-acetylgalactosaminide beta-1,3-galactosyltransferase n=1 Tax=Wuchereria bancrofti TaxID=6293 RepID=A0A3P7DGR2_WUCBA|nr:unnamed protein product [Wuchereria bancrofti]